MNKRQKRKRFKKKYGISADHFKNALERGFAVNPVIERFCGKQVVPQKLPSNPIEITWVSTRPKILHTDSNEVEPIIESNK
jgi:hypothetical protein